MSTDTRLSSGPRTTLGGGAEGPPPPTIDPMTTETPHPAPAAPHGADTRVVGLLVGVRVVRAADGGEPGAGQHLVRGLCFVVDGLVSGLVGLVVILRSSRQRRVGDMAAGTLVVRDRA